jgi:pimeloyl-ACP methyl ester carboxylesterase
MRLRTKIIRLILIVILTPVIGLLVLQSRMIYHPRPYGAAELDAFRSSGGDRIEYETSQGRQVAYYLPPREASPAGKIWLCFAGNGSLALDWLPLADRWDPHFAYLLIDYPGYGECTGAPNPARIRESSHAAFAALAKKEGLDETRMRNRVCVLGHSIGCASGLMAAADLKAPQVVLISPFTSMYEMARRVVGWPLCCLNRHGFDNRSELQKLNDQGAAVTIFHGVDDEVIPVAMGRELAAAFPAHIKLHELPHLHHSDIVWAAAREIGDAMK